MALTGMALGGGLGFAAGGPAGAALGAGLGSMAEDQLAGPSSPGTAVAPPAAVQYEGTGYDYGSAMQGADTRGAYLADYSMADQDRALAGQSREAQLAELERLRATARGEGISAAALQMQQAQEQAAQNAMNIAASARGSSAQALASRDAMRAQALGAQTSARDTAIIRAQEALQAQQAATGLVSGMRTQAGQERAASMGQAQFQAQQQQAARGQNDARAMALLQAQIEEAKARAGVQGSNESRALEARLAQMQASNAAYQADKQRSTQMGTALIAAGGSMAAQQGSKPNEPAPNPNQNKGGAPAPPAWAPSNGQNDV